MARGGGANVWNQGGGVTTAEGGPEGGAKAAQDQSGWGQSVRGRAKAEGRALEDSGPDMRGGTRRCEGRGGVGPKPGKGQGQK